MNPEIKKYQGPKIVETGRQVELNQPDKLPLGLVIIIDDEKDFRTQMDLIFGTILGDGIQIDTFARPHAAMIRATEWVQANPDKGLLVFTDMQMPGITGATVGHTLIGINNLHVIHWSAAAKPENLSGEFYNKLDFLLVNDPHTLSKIKDVVGNHFTFGG
jgi:hypothetical protein